MQFKGFVLGNHLSQQISVKSFERDTSLDLVTVGQYYKMREAIFNNVIRIEVYINDKYI